jgi:UPF0755 protein
MTLTKRGRSLVALGLVGAFFGTVALGAFIWLHSIGVYGSSDPGREVAVTIPEGANAEEVGTILVDSGVISSGLGWRIYLFRHGGSEDIQAGDYMLRTGLVPEDALAEILEEGPAGPEVWRVTFPEGLWLTEMAARLEEGTDLSGAKFLRLVEGAKVPSSLLPEDVDTLEGLLFPSTYEFLKDATERDVVLRMVEQMEEQLADLDLSMAGKVNLTEYDIVTIASMIEAETRVDEERPKVARVIYNRLSQGIALGIDATFLYALRERKDSLTASELAIDSPYNLRQNVGLPPTPIGAPGAASLQAAADPAQGDWLYYVLADCEGNHAFSSSNSEFLQDKRAYQALEC